VGTALSRSSAISALSRAYPIGGLPTSDACRAQHLGWEPRDGGKPGLESVKRLGFTHASFYVSAVPGWPAG
jgi:hypothetical protein